MLLSSRSASKAPRLRLRCAQEYCLARIRYESQAAASRRRKSPYARHPIAATRWATARRISCVCTIPLTGWLFDVGSRCWRNRNTTEANGASRDRRLCCAAPFCLPRSVARARSWHGRIAWRWQRPRPERHSAISVSLHSTRSCAVSRARRKFTESDLRDGAFAQFADVETLWRHNTFFVGRRTWPRSARRLAVFPSR